MYAVIMAGGGGTRLWPLSRAARPKPFLPLLDGISLLAATVARIRPLVGVADTFVVTDARYVELVQALVPDLPAGNVLAEPAGRNTAAAVALAAAALERPGDEVMVVLPADQVVSDEDEFRAALAAAAARAMRGDMVTLGIAPTEPAIGYGYVLATGDPIVDLGRPGWRVDRFEEKPSAARAEELIRSGAASWNAGIFVWRRDTLLAGLEAHAPDILAPIRAAIARAGGRDLAGLEGVYPTIRTTSIDYALLEPASIEGRVAVVPVDCGWSDLGSWSALLEALATRDGSASVIQAGEGSDVIAVGAHDVLVHASGGRTVALIGVHGLIVVDTPDALLVCAPEAAQDVRRVVERLVDDGRSDLL